MIKLNKIAYALMLALIVQVSANADIIVPIEGMRADQVADGSVSGFAVTGSLTSTNTYTFSLTQTADLDSGGVADTLSFDLIYEAYTGSSFSSVSGDVTLGTATIPTFNNQNWHSNGLDPNETLSLQVGNISYTDGEGDGTVVFNGFTEIQTTSYAATPAGDIDYYVGLAGATTVTVDPTAQIDLTSNGTSPAVFLTAADGPARIRNLDFEFCIVPVPEPSSLMLLGLALSGLTFRRNRRV